MDLVHNLFLATLILSAAITAGIGVYAFRRRDARCAKSVIAMMTVITWWTLFYAVLVAISVPPISNSWQTVLDLLFRIMYLGVILLPPAFMVFIFRFVGFGQWVTPRTLALLSIEPVAATLLIWIPPQHGPLAGVFDFHVGEYATLGPGFQWHSTYAFLLAAAGYVLLAWSAWRAPSFYRRQAAMLFFGGLAVIGANVLSITYLLPYYAIDLTSLGFMVLGLLMAYSLRGQGLLDLLPVARHEVVDAMPDGVVVIDAQNRAVDINPAAGHLLRLDAHVEPGASVADFFPAWHELLAARADATAFTREIRLGPDQTAHVSVQATPLRDPRGTPGGWIVVLRDITRIKTVEDELRAQLESNEALRKDLQEQAVRDGLTGLYNRRFLEESLARELERAGRAAGSIVVCLLDLDGFKAVNDTHGHGVGDRVLKNLAALLQSQTRRADVACRYGGEEFVILMPGTTLCTGVERMDVLRRRFQSQTIELDDGATIRPCFSAGVACFPDHGISAQSLLRAADQALYAAKEAGRDRVFAAAHTAATGPQQPRHAPTTRAATSNA